MQIKRLFWKNGKLWLFMQLLFRLVLLIGNVVDEKNDAGGICLCFY